MKRSSFHPFHHMDTDAKLISIGVIVALAVFAFDLYEPLGVAAGVPYILPVLFCLSAKNPSCLYWMAAIGSVLTVVGFFLSPDGGVLWMVLVNRGLAIFAIWAVAIFGTMRLLELNKRQAAEKKLVRQKARSAQFLNVAANTMVALDRRGHVTLLNRAGCALLECDENRVLGLDWFENFIPAEQRDQVRAEYQNIIGGKSKLLRAHENEIITVTGDRKLVRWLNAVVLDEDGNINGTISSGEDITESKSLESQLRQAQKMEAVGQLTGGIAHDFNNLLAIIEGNLSLLEDDIDGGRDLSADDLRESVLPALEASKRGAELTHRLLAFSRKQALRPVVLDINSVAQGMEGLLRRTLGEDIDLSWHLGCESWLTEADASELENVLLNLALNARDAMSGGGGKMTIETGEVTLDDGYAALHADVTAGDYVMLAVTDTGTGMDAKTREKVFEPFFTTKDVGKGTGLGLSMVYGFAKQSSGHAAVYSEPGEGTTIKLSLPRSAAPEATALEKGHKTLADGGHETILVIEDDEDVRRMTRRILSRLGYRVLEAGDGQAALATLAAEDHIDLLLTDVVLPGGMSGPDLVKAVLNKTPDLKILYMSGYTENAILHHGRLDEGVNLICKPFSHVELGTKVRGVLDIIT